MAVRSSALRGRPRDPELDRRILAAALVALARRGYAGVSVEAVAAAAGVGKTTIYRRYAGKDDLIAAALEALASAVELPDTGSTRTDLMEYLERLHDTVLKGPGIPAFAALLVEGRRNRRLLNLLHERLVGRRRELFRLALRRGIERGEIRPEADVDAAADAVFGAFFARHLIGLPVTRAWMRSLVDTVWGGLEARRERLPSPAEGRAHPGEADRPGRPSGSGAPDASGRR
ncbi:MAG TPA: TetR-like C-terminal domain-containing protein [Dehalococcoidia bacterium]|nr:TetR-like C-terminal domain-containing protein [Dehalococcoidia bacterium]